MEREYTDTELRDYAERLTMKLGVDGAADFVAASDYSRDTVDRLMKMIRGEVTTDRDAAMATDGELDDFGAGE